MSLLIILPSYIFYWIELLELVKDGICPHPIKYFPLSPKNYLLSVSTFRLVTEPVRRLSSLDEKVFFKVWEAAEILPRLCRLSFEGV